MSEHLTQKQGEHYCRQKLSAPELLAVSDHLGTCEACRRQVESAMGGDSAFFALRSEVFDATAETRNLVREHPTVEQTAAYVDERLGGEELQLMTDHLSSCEQCAVAVDDLRAFKNQIVDGLRHECRPAPVSPRTEGWRHRVVASLPPFFQRSPALALGTALTVLLLAVTGLLIWRALQEKEVKQEIVVTPPRPSEDAAPPLSAPVIARLNDGEGAITLDRDGKLSGVEQLPPAHQGMLKEALAGQRIERSLMLKGLTRRSSSLMSGDNQGKTFSVLEPVGRVLLSDRPEFSWSRLDGATGYVVEVYDGQFNLVATSPILTELSWATEHPLKRGGVYGWQVKAIKEGQEFKSPRPPAPQAKFRILDQAKANELTQARQAYASSHLALGLLYAQDGMLEEAEREFRALVKANPDSEIARRLLENLLATRR